MRIHKNTLIQLVIALLIGVSSVIGALLLLSQGAHARPALDTAAMEIDKSGDPDPVTAGKSLTYTIIVTNSSPYTVNVPFTDRLPSGVTFVSATATPGEACGEEPDGIVTCRLFPTGTLGYESAMVTIIVTVDPSTRDSITNTAEVPGRSASVNTGVNAIADLSIDKSDNDLDAVAGGQYLYTLTVHNGGPSDATGIVVSDTLPAGMTFSSATGATCSQDEQIVTCAPFATAAGDANRVIDITVDVAASVPHNTELLNTASANGAETDPDLDNNSDDEPTTVVRQADVSIVKSDSGLNAVAGGQYLYTLTVHNGGPSDATGIVVSDTLPAGMTFSSATGATCSQDEQIVTCAPFAIAAGGANRVIDITVDVAASVPHNTELLNTASANGAETDPDLDNNSDDEPTTVVRQADVSIIKSDSGLNAVAGGQYLYTLTVHNDGPSDATGIVVSDTLPAGMTFSSATGPTCSPVGQIVTCDSFDIATGNMTSIVMTVTVALTVPNGAILTNEARATATTADPDPLDNSDTETTTVSTETDLVISKAGDPDPVDAGDTLAYTLTITNDGPSDATGIAVTDTLPTEVTFTSATAGCTYDPGEHDFTCNVGSLAADATVMITTLVTVTSPLPNGTLLSNTATVGGDQTDPDQGNNSTLIQTTVRSAPILHLIKGDGPDPVEAGAQLVYTLTYTNTGNEIATSAVITDVLDGNVTYFDAAPPAQGTGSIRYWPISDLAPDGPHHIHVTATVNSPLTNGTMLTNTAWLDTGQTSPLSTTQQTIVHSRPVLTITKIGSPDPVTAGLTLRYTIVISNYGNENASTVTVIEDYDPNTHFVYATPNPDPGSGNRQWTFPTLDVGTSEIINVVVQVDSPLSVGTVLTNHATLDSDQTLPITQTEVTSVTSASELTVTKLDLPDPVQAGANLVYYISYGNFGTATAENVVVRETYDSRISFDSALPSPEVGTDNVWNVGDLPVGAGGNIIVTVRVDTPLTNGTILTNQVTIDSVHTSSLSYTETTTVSSAPDLTFTVIDHPDPVIVGDFLTYTLRCTNEGNADATQVVITATLDPNVTLITASPMPTGIEGSTAYWQIGDISGEGGYAEIVVSTAVTLPLPNGTVLDFTAQLVDAEGDFLERTAQTTVNAPILHLAKSDTPDPVQAGDLLTYTFTYVNTGDAIAHNTIITDSLDPNVTLLSADPPALGSGQLRYWTIGDLPPDGPHQITVRVRVHSPLPNNTILTNTAAIESNQTISVTVVETTTVHSAPILDLAKSDNPDPVQAGDLLTYTLAYSNIGNEIARNVVITEVLDPNTSYAGASLVPSVWISDTLFYWNIGDLSPGPPSQITLRVAVTMPLTNGTVLTNTTLIDSRKTLAYPVVENTTVKSAPILSLSKSDGVSTAYAGDILIYILTYTNTGNENAYSITITDTLPSYIEYVGCEIQDGNCQLAQPNGDEVVFHIPAIIAHTSGQGQVLARVIDPLPASATSIVNRTKMTAPSLPAPIQAQDMDHVGTLPDLLVAAGRHTPSLFSPGNRMTYIVPYGNAGHRDAENVIITTTLPVSTTYVGSGWHSSDGRTYTHVVGDLSAGDWLQPNRVYANSGGSLVLAWSSPQAIDTKSVAWGDWDGDEDLDLVAGHWGEPSQVYANTGSELVATWSSAETNFTESVAWGDWDGDGDLDLTVGNLGQRNRVYTNTGSGLEETWAAWSSPEVDDTTSVAWGDWDGDGDFDLAVGNYNDVNLVYENLTGTLKLDLDQGFGWKSAGYLSATRSVAWGDWDGDGDLDLAVGNLGQPNQVYTNTGGNLALAWSSPETDTTTSVAWGDWDADGDPDLAVGNLGQPNRVYTNTGGSLALAWSSAETDDTESVAWGNWDEGGDLDLAVGNLGQPNRVYANTGGDMALAWSSPEMDNTASVAWGDWDGDGDLDLAVGNARRTVTFTVEHLNVEHPNLPQPIAPEFNTPFNISSLGTQDTNPADNTACTFIGVPDLVVTGFTIEPSPPQPDEPVTFTIVLENQGTGTAWNPNNQGGFWVDVFVAPVVSYPYDRDGDIYVVPPVLAAGETHTVVITKYWSTSKRISFTEQQLRQITGFYVKVDNFRDPHYGLVPESNEMNNLGEPIILRPYRVYLPLVAR